MAAILSGENNLAQQGRSQISVSWQTAISAALSSFKNLNFAQLKYIVNAPNNTD